MNVKFNYSKNNHFQLLPIKHVSDSDKNIFLFGFAHKNMALIFNKKVKIKPVYKIKEYVNTYNKDVTGVKPKHYDVYSALMHSIYLVDIKESINIYRKEITELIYKHPDTIIDLFNQLKINYINKSSLTIINTIIDDKTDDRLIRGLAFLIAKNNDAYIARDNNKEWTEILNDIVDAIKKINKEFKYNPNSRIAFRDAVLENIKLEQNKAPDIQPMRKPPVVNKKPNNAWLTNDKMQNPLMLLASVMVIPFGLYFYRKFKK